MQSKRPFADAVAENVIDALQSGLMPWQRTDAGSAPLALPMNPFNGHRYKAANAVHLAAQGRDDPRWLTYDQAQRMGAQVLLGEKGTRVQYWRFHDDKGAKLDKPECLTAVVFNAEQIAGMPALQPHQRPDATERARGILEASGASIKEHTEYRPAYRASADKIQLPTPEAAGGQEQFCSVALRELARWSGHESRLGRDVDHPFGSDGAAREALRAEMAGALLADTLGMRYMPGSSPYHDAWARLIEQDPLELFRAAADAEAIHTYVMQFDHPRQQQGVRQQAAPAIQLGHEQAAIDAQESCLGQHLDQENARIDAALAEVETPARQRHARAGLHPGR
jgi:putative DNA primase/helicase